MQAPHFALNGAAFVNGKLQADVWSIHDLQGKWTIIAIFPSSHTPVCQATCLGLAEKQFDLAKYDAQAVGICNNYIADIYAWVEKNKIAIPVLSDFLNRTTTGYFAGLNADGSARRKTLLVSPEGHIVWEHDTNCPLNEDAEHHVEEVLQVLAEQAEEFEAPKNELPQGIPSDKAQEIIRQLEEQEGNEVLEITLEPDSST